MNASSFFPADVLVDLTTLLAVQLSFSRLNLKRLILGQLLLSAFTLWALCTGGARWMHLPLLILGAAAATGERRPGRILEAAIIMLCTGALAAGFHLSAGLLGALIGCGALIFLLRRHRHLNFQWNIELLIEKNGCISSVPALIDTGNRLREHASGLPVLIVEESAVPEICAEMHRLDAHELRHLPYGVLGGSGAIPCFPPDKIEMILPGSGVRKAPPCYLAIFPGRIPGRTRALAPPEFAIAAQAKPNLTLEILKKARRVFYGIFKCKTIDLRHGRAVSKGLRLLHRRQRSASAAAEP